MFADDTNAIMENNDKNIASFWECLYIYYANFGSIVNHSKIGLRDKHLKPPLWIIKEGCKPILVGEIVCTLSIPMGFKVSIKKC